MKELLEGMGINTSIESLAESGVDSLKLIEVITLLEEENNISIPLDKALGIHEVHQLLELMEESK